MTDTAATDAAALAALLDWYREAGVDLATDEAPHDHFAEFAALRQKRAEVAVKSAPATPEEAAANALALAATAGSLAELQALMERFDGCELKRTARQLVFADGNPTARVMLVGEAPGRDEDEQGKPFAGKSGQMLDKMLAAIGLDRTSVYIANIIPWRPPGNRKPTQMEISICLPFIARHIALAAPDVLFFIGELAALHLLNQREGILKVRGRWFDYDAGGKSIPALASLTPQYLLNTPMNKKLAWRDLRLLDEKLRTLEPAAGPRR